MIDKINEHLNKQKGIQIKKGIEPFGWEVVVTHLQKCADQEFAGAPIGILSYQLNQAEEIPEVKQVMDYINNELDLKIFDAHIFVAFTKTAKGKIHTDNHNVLLWGITDNMIVHLYDDAESDPYYSEELNKGDLFLIPADCMHRVESTGARALVSFGIEVSPGKNYNSEITNPYVKINKEDNNDQED